MKGGSRSNNEVYSYWVFPDYIGDHLILLLMDMREHAPSDDGLVPVDNGMEPPSVLSETLVNVGDMRHNNGRAIYLLEVVELLLKPVKHVTWVFELRHSIEVIFVADV